MQFGVPQTGLQHCKLHVHACGDASWVSDCLSGNKAPSALYYEGGLEGKAWHQD